MVNKNRLIHQNKAQTILITPIKRVRYYKPNVCKINFQYPNSWQKICCSTDDINEEKTKCIKMKLEENIYESYQFLCSTQKYLKCDGECLKYGPKCQKLIPTTYTPPLQKSPTLTKRISPTISSFIDPSPIKVFITENRDTPNIYVFGLDINGNNSFYRHISGTIFHSVSNCSANKPIDEITSNNIKTYTILKENDKNNKVNYEINLKISYMKNSGTVGNFDISYQVVDNNKPNDFIYLKTLEAKSLKMSFVRGPGLITPNISLDCLEAK